MQTSGVEIPPWAQQSQQCRVMLRDLGSDPLLCVTSGMSLPLPAIGFLTYIEKQVHSI